MARVVLIGTVSAFRVGCTLLVFRGVLHGGSWGVISGATSKVTIVTTHIEGLTTPLITIVTLLITPLKPYRTLKGTP